MQLLISCHYNTNFSHKKNGEGESIILVVHFGVHSMALNYGTRTHKIRRRSLGNSEFRVSMGGLESFRMRYQIIFNDVCGESSNFCKENSKFVCQVAFSYGRV